MPKDIKKQYHFLDLPYNSTVEDIEIRSNALIKVLRARAIKKGVNNTFKIDKVKASRDKILNYVQQNGIPKGNGVLYDVSINTIYTQLFTFVAIIVLAICSIMSLI